MKASEPGTVMWRKSSRSGDNGNCAEVGRLRHGIAVRDGKDPHGPALIFTPAGWAKFIQGAKDGAFDHE